MANILQFNENPNQLGGTQLGKMAHEIVEQGVQRVTPSGVKNDKMPKTTNIVRDALNK